MTVITIEIGGYVQPWQRTIYKNFVTAPESRAYKQQIKLACIEAMRGRELLLGFIGVDIEIMCRPPPSWSKKKIAWAMEGKIFPTHCDVDNQIKALFDGMNKLVYEDDRRINYLQVRREYGAEDKAIVTVTSL